ncbi:transposase [Streptomyces glaucescens]
MHFAAVAGLLYVVSLHLQQGAGLTPFAAAGIMAPLSLGIIITSFRVRDHIQRLGRRLVLAGSVVTLLGVLGQLATIVAAPGLPVVLAVPLFVTGLGMGCCFGSLFSTALGGVNDQQAGSASGTLNALQQIANATGAALVSTMCARHRRRRQGRGDPQPHRDRRDPRPGRRDHPAAAPTRGSRPLLTAKNQDPQLVEQAGEGGAVAGEGGEATFTCPDLTAFCRLEELGLEVIGQRLEPGQAVLACRVVEPDPWCRRCGCEGAPRGTVTRRLVHEPLGWRPTTLLVTVRRYRCTGCGHVWRQDTSRAAEPRAKPSRRRLRWALEAIVVQHLTVARVAEGLGVAWNTANDAVLAEGKRVLIDDVGRFDGVTAIGVDEHVWRHTRRGDKYVTVIIDLTGIREGIGRARLLGMVEGRFKQAFKTWLAERPEAWRNQVEVVAMDGFTGFKTATAEELPDAVAVMDPFHVVRLAGDALDRCRRRVQQALHGHRGRKSDPLYSARRTLHTGVDLLTGKQKTRLAALFADDAHMEVEATWGIYQRMIATYREDDRRRGRELMSQLIESISHSVPKALTESITLGWTLKKRAADVLAYFDRPGTSNGPTEAINGRLEHLRGSALGFRT